MLVPVFPREALVLSPVFVSRLKNVVFPVKDNPISPIFKFITPFKQYM